jgi:hypothetical protein
MGAPTTTHESRVGQLETLAALAGFSAPFVLPWRLRPDVARTCPYNGAVFLGDGKHTEDPSCAATRARLRWYGIAAPTLSATGTVTLVLAVPAGPAVAQWEQTLLLAASSRMVPGPSATTIIGDTAVIAIRTRCL